MDKINEIFSFLYNGNSNTLYFVLGGVSLIIIIIIIIFLAVASKKEKKESKIEVKKEENIKKETIKEEPSSLSETQMLNNMLMQKEDSAELAGKIEDINDNENIEDNVYIEKTFETDYHIPVIELDKFENNIVEETQEKEKLEDFQIEPLEQPKNPNAEEEAFSLKLDEITIDDLEPQNDNTGTISIPKMKLIDVEADLLEKQEEITQIENSPLEENIKPDEKEVDNNVDTNNTITISNDEIKKRLANLKKETKKVENKEEIKNIQEEVSLDEELENIIKTVGLEDTMIIPNIKSEENILGK